MEIKRCYFANAHESIGIVIAFWFFALLKPLNEFQLLMEFFVSLFLRSNLGT